MPPSLYAVSGAAQFCTSSDSLWIQQAICTRHQEGESPTLPIPCFPTQQCWLIRSTTMPYGHGRMCSFYHTDWCKVEKKVCASQTSQKILPEFTNLYKTFLFYSFCILTHFLSGMQWRFKFYHQTPTCYKILWMVYAWTFTFS